jgi:hypothetical protein
MITSLKNPQNDIQQKIQNQTQISSYSKLFRSPRNSGGKMNDTGAENRRHESSSDLPTEPDNGSTTTKYKSMF